jgi:hypothetical protein
VRDYEDRFREKGANLAAVGLGDKTYARLFREETGIQFPLLIDEGRVAYKAVGLQSANLLHLIRKENKVARKRARDAGFVQKGLGKDPFQLGGSFVFGPGNLDRFAHVSETFGDNAQPETLLTAVVAVPRLES